MSTPTFDAFKADDRDIRSECCNARVQEALRRINTTAGEQIVYACNQCSKLYVVRERDEVTTESLQ